MTDSRSLAGKLHRHASLMPRNGVPDVGRGLMFPRLANDQAQRSSMLRKNDTCLLSSLRSPPIGDSTNPDSNFIPRLRPSCSSFSLISFNDFLPKFRYFSMSASVLMAN